MYVDIVHSAMMFDDTHEFHFVIRFDYLTAP